MIILINKVFVLELEKLGKRYLPIDSRQGWLVVQNNYRCLKWANVA